MPADEPTRTADAAVPPTEDDVTRPRPEHASPPDLIPGYELLEPVGSGGMGVVYRARQLRLNRIVAVKLVLSGHPHKGRDLARFLAEAEAAAAIDHPNVVRVHEAGEAGGRPFLALEYLPGGTLAERLKGGRVDPTSAAGLVATIARGVAAAHDLGIVHRDLKPANVLFDAGGEPKVADFGLAKRAGGSDLTATQAVMGTPAYMAPEQARGGTKFVGPAADVWALGVILYECLTGTRPFRDPDPVALLRAVAEDDPDPPRKRVPGLPRDLELVCLKCLTRDPAGRYPTAAELADDLDRFRTGQAVSVRAPGFVERAGRWARRKPARAAAYGLGVLALLLGTFGLTAAWLWRDAVSARNDAVSARNDAAAARDQLDDYNRMVVAALRTTEESRARLATAEDRLARLEYAHSMQVALNDWRDGQTGSALNRLTAARKDLRGWEWRYIHRLCYSHQVCVQPGADELTAVAFSPDGKRLVTGGDDALAHVWDAATGLELVELKGHTERIRTVAFAANGSRVVTGSMDGTARIWDASTGKELVLLRGSQRLDIGLAAASPTGKRVLTAGMAPDARLWDLDSGAAVAVLPGNGKYVVRAAFSGDGSRIITAADDGDVRVWDADGKPLTVLRPRGTKTIGVSLSRDGSRAVTLGEDGNVRVWDVKTASETYTRTGHNERLKAVAVSPDGKRVATGGDGMIGYVWTAGSDPTTLGLRGHTDRVTAIAFSPDGTRVATAAEDGTARVWDAHASPEFTVRTTDPHGARGVHSVVAAAFSPDGRQFAAGNPLRPMGLWDLTPWAPARAPAARLGQGATPFAPDGSRLVADAPDTIPRAFDRKTGAEVLVFRSSATPEDSRQLGRSVAYSPDGALVAGVNARGSVDVWDARTAAHRYRLEGHRQAVRSVQFSRDGRRLATISTDQTARLWDAETGAVQHVLIGHTGEVFSAAFDRDGTRLATTCYDGTTRVFDTQTGRQAVYLRGHHGSVLACTFSPDGMRLATGGSDGTIRLWDTRTWAEVLVLRRPNTVVWSLTFSPDGNLLAAGHEDGTVSFWDGTGPDLAPAPANK